MRKVMPEQFWKEIGPQNVHPSIVGRYPYTSIFKTPSGFEYGRIENKLLDHVKVESNYYLRD